MTSLASITAFSVPHFHSNLPYPAASIPVLAGVTSPQERRPVGSGRNSSESQGEEPADRNSVQATTSAPVSRTLAAVVGQLGATTSAVGHEVDVTGVF